MKKLSFLLTALLLWQLGNAQDAQLSQHYSMPMYFNPAYTGVFDGSMRASIAGRQQWSNVTSYESAMVAVDGVINKQQQMQKLNGDYFGIGAWAIQDYEGERDGGIGQTNTNAMFSVSFNKQISGSPRQYFSVGAQVGYIRQAYGSDYIWGRGFEGGPNTDPTVNTEVESTSDYDVSAGIGYYSAVNDRFDFYSGLSLYHLNRPKLTIVENSDERQLLRFNLHMSAKYKVNDKFNLMPTMMVSTQGPSMNANLGAYVQYNLGDERDYGIAVGAQFRAVGSDDNRFDPESGILGIMLDIKTLSIGYTYDYNISDLSDLSGQTVGTNEVSLRFRLPVENDSNDLYPVF